MTREELRLDLLKRFPESWGTFCFADVIPEMGESMLIIRDFSTSGAESNMKVSFAFQLDPILKETLANKCWIAAQKEKIERINYRADYIEFRYKEDVFHPYSVNLSQYAGNISAETLRIICTNIYNGNITK